MEPLESRLLFSAEHVPGVGAGLISIDALEDDLAEDRRVAIAAISDQVLANSFHDQNRLIEQVETVAFVDLNLDGADQLIEILSRQNITLESIELGADGIKHPSDRLQHYSNLESIQIYSHGSNSVLTLGNAVLSQGRYCSC